MIILFILSIVFSTIIISEFFGKGSPLYSRLTSFIIIYFSNILIFSITTYLFFNEYLINLLDIISSSVFIILSWFGLRNHLSNSITIALLLLVEKHNGITAHSLEKKYDIKLSTDNRINQLIKAGYFGENLELTLTAKSSLLFKVIKYLYV